MLMRILGLRPNERQSFLNVLWLCASLSLDVIAGIWKQDFGTHTHCGLQTHSFHTVFQIGSLGKQIHQLKDRY